MVYERMPTDFLGALIKVDALIFEVDFPTKK